MAEISKIAKERMTEAAGGELLLQVFEVMAAQLALMESTGQFTQFQFVEASELKEGDLIPEVHLSLRKFEGHHVPQELLDSLKENETGAE